MNRHRIYKPVNRQLAQHLLGCLSKHNRNERRKESKMQKIQTFTSILYKLNVFVKKKNTNKQFASNATKRLFPKANRFIGKTIKIPNQINRLRPTCLPHVS